MAKASNRFALWLTIGRILSMLVVFCMPLVMTRVLSQSDYGVFSQYFTLYTALNVIFALGFHSNLFFFYPTADGIEKDEYVSNTLFLLIFMSVCAIMILSLPFVGNSLFGSSRLGDYSFLVTMSIALAVPMNITSPLFTVREDKMGAVFYPAIAALFRVGTVTIVALIKKDLTSVFMSLVIYQSAIFLWVLLYTFKNHRIHFSHVKLKKQVLYSIPFGVTVALQMFSNYFDKIVCIKYLDAVQYAIYGTAFLSIPGINQVYDSLCQVNVVNMSRSFQEGDIKQVRQLYKDFVVKTLSFSTPIIIAVSVFAEEIIGFLYPTEYLPSAPFFRIYSLTFLTAMLGAGTVLRATGKTQYSLVSYAISSAIGLPATYVLISRYGIHGAIVGAVISIILPRLIQLLFEAKHTESSISNFLDWGKIGFVLSVGILVMIPMLAIKIVYKPALFICIVLSGIYVILCYYLYIRRSVFLVSRSSIISLVNRFKK